MDIQNQIDYWLESAKHDLDVAEALFETKKYDWCLYISHLVLEKTFKAFYVKATGNFPPKTHLLHVMAKEASVGLSEEQMDFLRKVNEFNIEARYPDYKMSFYKLCTKDFTVEYFNKIKEMYLWLLKII